MFLDVVGVGQHGTNNLCSLLYFLGNFLGSARARARRRFGRLICGAGSGLCYDGLGLGYTLDSYEFGLED